MWLEHLTYIQNLEMIMLICATSDREQKGLQYMQHPLNLIRNKIMVGECGGHGIINMLENISYVEVYCLKSK